MSIDGSSKIKIKKQNDTVLKIVNHSTVVQVHLWLLKQEFMLSIDISSNFNCNNFSVAPFKINQFFNVLFHYITSLVPAMRTSGFKSKFPSSYSTFI